MNPAELLQGTERRDRMAAFTGEPHRDEFFSKEPYLSPAWLAREYAQLWPCVWQLACREEEIPKVGDFVEYGIGRESIIVVRSAAETISAFYNSCQHRGRRLVNGRGNARQLRCGFHGWRYELDGRCAEIVDQTEWFGLRREDADLPRVRVATWQGWVFINMDDKAGPLADFLDPIPSLVDPFEFGKMRCRWHKTVVLPANWKTISEAFLEGYHVYATHPQIPPYYDDRTVSRRLGRHAHQISPPDHLGFGVPAPRLGITEPGDPRRLMAKFIEEYENDLKAQFTPRDVLAARTLLDAPDGLTPGELYMRFYEKTTELNRAAGVEERKVTLEQIGKAGFLVSVFPNHTFLPTHDGVLAYRFRPNGDDPNSGIMDFWSLMRYAPGEAPPFEHVFVDDWRKDGWGRILRQDFDNLLQLQAGMHSRGFKGLRPNPIQESMIANFRTSLEQFMAAGEPR